MNRHTPGPWLKDAGSIYAKCQLNDEGMSTQSPLAEVTSDEDNDPYYHGNCDLIAAAPELLEALQRTLSWLSSYPGGGAHGCYDQARAAIAKATGEINEP